MKKVQGTVISQECLLPGIYSLLISCEEAWDNALPGQFVNFYLEKSSHLLPRPISICDILPEGALRFVYRVAGEGTRYLSSLQARETVNLSTPLGNGFPVGDYEGKKVLLVGGGIGVPPMVECAQALKKQGSAVVSVMGYRSEQFLTEELRAQGELFIATEDGCAGTKGTVIDAMKEADLTADVIFTCGPGPMLRAVAAYAKEKGIRWFVSMEERMACGVGACLACVCERRGEDPHFHTKTARVCKDGPVFDSEEVVL